MKTLDEVKNEVQHERTGHDFDYEWGGEFGSIASVLDEAAKRYAKAALEEFIQRYYDSNDEDTDNIARSVISDLK